MITTADFESLTGYLDGVFNETKTAKLAKSVGLNQIFDVKNSNKLVHTELLLHGDNPIKEVAEGADLPESTLEQGDTISWTQRYFGGKRVLTKKARKFTDWQGVKNGDLNWIATQLVKASIDNVDMSLADVLLNGWDTSYTDVYDSTVSAVGPDGLALFSASHTNGVNSTTFSNIINDGTNNNPTLSRAAVVKERATAKRYKSVGGLSTPVNLDTLVVGPDLEDLAYRELHSNQIAGSANNDINPKPIKSINIVTWDRLGSNSQGVDTSDFWFLMDSEEVKETLKCKFSEKITLDAPEQVYANKNWEWTCDFFYSLGFSFAPYIRGSKGTNS